MARIKKDSVPLCARIESKINSRLEDYCKQSGQSKTTAVERALEMLIDDYENKQKLLNK